MKLTTCVKPGCNGEIIRSVFVHRPANLCKLCGTVYDAKGKIRMTTRDWTPLIAQCSIGYAKFRQLEK